MVCDFALFIELAQKAPQGGKNSMKNYIKFYANGFCQVAQDRQKSEPIFRYRDLHKKTALRRLKF